MSDMRDVRDLGADMLEHIQFTICWKPGLDPFCWTWTGEVQNKGYGCLGGRANITHRLAYMILVGTIPAGLTLDHRCLNKLCCNPAHLEPVTVQENIRRAVVARQAAKEPNGDARNEWQRAQGRAAAEALAGLIS